MNDQTFNDATTPTKKQAKDYKILSPSEIWAMDLVKPDPILHPILHPESVIMVYGKTGVGKTHFALGCATAIATGGKFLKYHAPKPKKVLYIDGESAGYDLKKRTEAIAAQIEVNRFNENIRFLSSTLNDGALPNFAEPADHGIIDELIEGYDVIFLDNLFTLTFSESDPNSILSWQAVQRWLNRQKAMGKAFFIVHHAGKGGNQLGTSGREVILSTNIRLEAPEGHEAEDGAQFKVSYDKARLFNGADAASFEASFNGTDWECKESDQAAKIRIIELHKEGKTNRQIEAILKKEGLEPNGLGTVGRKIKKYYEEKSNH